MAKRCVPARCVKKGCAPKKTKKGACRAARGKGACLAFKTCHGRRVCAKRAKHSGSYRKAHTPYLERKRAELESRETARFSGSRRRR